ncbi:uncharacterized protein PFL1_03603 [Pseudozyma flocculosa PF-1]|uniref:Uncharacterized protein n=2 Tax=Pseudozyma flocculosa TaxID=84751 RepID=A0A5C3F7X5_9BASI|nr:uncharacterized protein PFL1_03603 [Pseudozyma flocculosa PF-1]EPQ28800.1 hypothetical protein PFL1_03603 [Pseudozyma flocculosa PF-1]SPO39411.1 uncharacterized protein PSFLO_04892 [Pseudozyma flocculosa]
MVLYVEGDVVEYRPFGGEVKTGKIDKIEVKTGGHVDIKYHINGETFISTQIIGKTKQ